MPARMTVTFRCGESGCGSYIPEVLQLNDWAQVSRRMEEAKKNIAQCGWIVCEAECRLICAECMRRSAERLDEPPGDEEEEEDEIGEPETRTFNDWCNCGSCREARGEEESEGDALF